MEYIKLSEVDFKKNIGRRVFVEFYITDVAVRLQKDGVTKFIRFTAKCNSVKEECKIFQVKDEQIEKIKNNKTYRGAIDIQDYDKAPNGYSLLVYNIEECEFGFGYFADRMDNIGRYNDIISMYLKYLGDSIYGRLANEIISSNWDKFSTWSAAREMHHDKLGGLIAHSAEVVIFAVGIAESYKSIYGAGAINMHLLIAAAICHDIGKINEYETNLSTGSTEWSSTSTFETHISNGAKIIDRCALKLGIDTLNNIGSSDDIEAVNMLIHCVLSHHNKLEWGSPITPHTLEAYILSMADLIDADTYRMSKVLDKVDSGKCEKAKDNRYKCEVYKQCGGLAYRI